MFNSLSGVHVGFGWPLLEPEDDVVAPLLDPDVVVPLDDEVVPLEEAVAPDDEDVVPDEEVESTS